MKWSGSAKTMNSGQEEDDDDPIAVLGGLEINMEGDTSDE